jgi:hypothetical protein
MAAVHVAARVGSVQMLSGLAQRKADINCLDAFGQLPAVMAAKVCNHVRRLGRWSL